MRRRRPTSRRRSLWSFPKRARGGRKRLAKRHLLFEPLEARELLSVSPLEEEVLVAGSPVGQQTLHDSGRAVAAVSEVGYLVAFSSDAGGNGWDVYGQRFSPFGERVGSEIVLNSTLSGDQDRASVAMAPDGSFVAVWQSAGQDGSGAGVYARRFSAEGTPLSDEFLVNTTPQNDQEFPSVDWLSGGGFVAVWSGRGDGDNAGVFARLFSSDGTALGDEFRVNSTTQAQQKLASVAATADGGFVVAWTSYGAPDGHSLDVFARRFDGAGNALGDQFRVNTETHCQQEFPAVAGAPDGGFVVAWQSKLEDGSGYGVFARRFGADGAPVGEEFAVNTWTDGDQLDPSVAFDSQGNLLVAFSGQGLGDTSGVFLRKFGPDGTPLFEEFLANSTTEGTQQYPVVQAAGSGYVVAWSGAGAGDDQGVYVRRFGTAPSTSGIDNVSVPEDAPPTTIPLWDAFEDPENADTELSFEVAGNTNPTLFSATTIDAATGQLTLDYAPDAFGAADITIRASDPGGLWRETAFTVNVTPVNDGPTTSGLAPVAVEEDAAPTVIDLYAAFEDVDNADSELDYQVVDNTNPALFSAVTIDPESGELALEYAPDAFGAAELTVRATDPGGLWVESVLSVEVTAVNDVPTWSGMPDVLGAGGTIVRVDLGPGFHDVDNTFGELVFEVLGNSNPSLVTQALVDESRGELVLHLAEEKTGTAELVVRATDPGGLSAEGTIAVEATEGPVVGLLMVSPSLVLPDVPVGFAAFEVVAGESPVTAVRF